MLMTSSAFGAGQPIPKRHTTEGKDVSPPLEWRDIPEGTRTFVLICDDPDAPTPEPWVHWLIYRIPRDVRSLPENVPPGGELQTPAGTLQGHNSWNSGRTLGYRGPAPPVGHGTHHYRFRLYAVDVALPDTPALHKTAVLEAVAGHILDEAELVGTCER